MELKKDILFSLSNKFKENLKKLYNKTIDDLIDEGYHLIGNMDIRTSIYDKRLKQFLLNYKEFDPFTKVKICNGNCQETKKSKGGLVSCNALHSHCICQERILNIHFIINKNFDLKSIIIIGICCAERFIENFETKRKCIINNCNNCVSNRFYCDKNKIHLNYSLCKEHKYFEKCIYCNEMIKVNKQLFDSFKDLDLFTNWRNKIKCNNCEEIVKLKKKIGIEINFKKKDPIIKLQEFIKYHLYISSFENTLVDFGKFQSKTWKYVKENHTSYCNWIINNKNFNHYKKKDLLFYLNLK